MGLFPCKDAVQLISVETIKCQQIFEVAIWPLADKSFYSNNNKYTEKDDEDNDDDVEDSGLKL